MKPIVQAIETSLSAFEIFCRVAHLPQAIFLDSANAPSKLGQYSFIAADPFLRIWSKNEQIYVNQQPTTGDPFKLLQTYWQQYPLTTHQHLPPFQGGIAGFWSYDLGYLLEKIPRPATDTLNMADMDIGFYDCVVAIEHTAATDKAWLFACGYPEQSVYKRTVRAQQRINAFLNLLHQPKPETPLSQIDDFSAPPPMSSFSQTKYLQTIECVKDYIARGEIYQANIAQRFRTPFRGSSLELYGKLRQTTVAPFAAYLNFGDTVIASASPERFLRCREGAVETRPIKGTRPRGATPTEDQALAASLLASPKDHAENVMIVDLLRNDLARVCQKYSIKVPELFALEKYPTVWHLVSTVVGQLAAGKTPLDLLQVAFPGGSITGAPKIRAMEIISAFEKEQRGVYCGSIGYLGFDGSLDTNIAIRTMIIKDGYLTFHGGGGIVADSEPLAEYEETLAKVKGFFDILA